MTNPKKYVRTDPPACLKKMPQDLRQITVAQFEAWARRLAETRPLEGKDSLREWQAVAQAQIVSAHTQLAAKRGDKDRLERGLANSMIVHAVGSAAVDLQTFGGDGWQAHVPRELIGGTPAA